MNLRNVFIVIYFLLSSVLFLTFQCDIFVWISFFISFILISFITFYHLFIEKDYSPFLSSYIVFNYLFFLIAPIIQIGSFIGSSNEFATMFPYEVDLTLKTNGLIVLFNLVFILSYVYFKKKYKDKIEKVVTLSKQRSLPLTILSLFVISLLVFILSFNFVLNELSRPNWVGFSYSIFQLLVQKKVLFIIPLALIILCYQYFKNLTIINKNSIIILVVFLISVFMLIWFKNPLTEKRNALGPIYIALIFLFSPKVMNTNLKTMAFLFFAMVLAFPLFQVFTHIDYSLETIINKPNLIVEEFANTKFVDTFNTLNYDAFSNVSATIDYVSQHGFSFGYQLLSGLLFFVPRAVWSSKPISTGELVGDHIIDEYGFNFSNLSNPLVSEGYINFGWLGVILFSFILAYVCIKFLIWLKSPDQLKSIVAFYFAIHLIFLLRGDFTNGFVYFIGTFVGVYFIPKIIHQSMYLLVKK